MWGSPLWKSESLQWSLNSTELRKGRRTVPVRFLSWRFRFRWTHCPTKSLSLPHSKIKEICSKWTFVRVLTLSKLLNVTTPASTLDCNIHYRACHMSYHTSQVTNVTNHWEIALDPLCDTILKMSPPQHQHVTVIHITWHVMCHITHHMLHHVTNVTNHRKQPWTPCVT